MGIRAETIIFIERAVEELGGYQGLRMCELGDQMMRDAGNRSAKRYFRHKGVEHTSIDQNEKHGALPYDLGSELSGLGEFDLVTNYGTSEHVADQYQVFKNIHQLTRVGGFMVHAIPMFGYWDNHGLVGYGEWFLSRLAGACGYKVIQSELAERTLKRDRKRLLVCAVLGKQKAEFISREQFNWLGQLYEYAGCVVQEIQHQATA